MALFELQDDRASVRFGGWLPVASAAAHTFSVAAVFAFLFSIITGLL